MEEVKDEALTGLLEYVRRQRGVDFSSYKESSLHRRLQHRMQTIEARSYADYLDHLQATPEELNALLDTLFINVTHFFRDKPAWDLIAEKVIPDLLKANESGQIRIWCAGVASGEEAYTIAILTAIAMGDDAFRERVKIFATDADEGALTSGRGGDYSDRQIEDVPEEYRGYFEKIDDRNYFRQDLRRNVIFGRHNLLEDAPISRLDLLICRNTLMYFNRDAQSRILARFHFALREEAALFLGKAETLLTRRQLFTPLDPKLRIFRKVAVQGFGRPATYASNQDALRLFPVPNVHIRQSAFDSSPIAQLLIDDDGKLASANEIARAQFNLSSADIGKSFAELEVSYRPFDLRSLIDQVEADGVPITVPSIERILPSGLRVFYDISVSPLHDGTIEGTAIGVSFADVTGAHDLRAQLEASKGELETAYEELQSTNEELETTNEELQSTIEELETTNEELQSTNEELETMNEELQSTNDEIRVINDQLTDRGDEVGRLNAYLRSIVDGQQVAVVVLDHELIVSIWNRQARELWGMHEDEVVRQPVLNLDIGLPVHQLRDPMRRVLRGENPMEVEILPAVNRKGKHFDCKVSITPLRDAKGAITGVILVMEPAAAE